MVDKQADAIPRLKSDDVIINAHRDLIFTSKRLIIAMGKDFESIPYRAITRFNTSNVATGLGISSIHVDVMSRKGSLELRFENEADRAHALELLNRYTL